MAGKIYRRRTYIPVRTIRADDTNSRVMALDLYAAKYLTALSQVSSFTAYQVSDDDESRLDIISTRAYGKPDLWWIIGLFNGIVHPIVELTTGSYVKIPNLGQVEFILQNKANDTSTSSRPTSASSGNITVDLR